MCIVKGTQKQNTNRKVEIKMDMFEKVEKLREVANVSFEEAKAALEEANGDVLDAMILLEKRGKTSTEKSSEYSTKYEGHKEVPAIIESKDSKNEKRHENARKFGEKMRNLWDKLCVNYLVVSRNENNIIKMPLLLFIAILIIGIEIVPILMVISLFFGFHYSFEGESDMKAANDISNKTEEFVDSVAAKVKDEYNKL